MSIECVKKGVFWRLIPMKENVLHEALKGKIMTGSRPVHHEEIEQIFATYDKV